MKPKLRFISNYNVSLYHFTEKLTIWDRFVSPTFKEYLEERFELDHNDIEVLNKLKLARAKLAWESETKLHDWANQGFPKVSSYNDIYVAMRHFELKINKNGGTLKEFLEKAQPAIDRIASQLVDKFERCGIEEDIAKMQQLIGYQPTLPEIPAFIVPTPTKNSYQGGANGDGITAEVYPEDKDLARILDLVAHEYAHKAFNASYYFENLQNKKDRDFFALQDESISWNTFSAHIEELIVRSVVDVRLTGKNPNKESQNYINRGTKRTDLYGLSWLHVEYIAPIIGYYLDGKVGVEQTRADLVSAFKDKVTHTLLEKSPSIHRGGRYSIASPLQ